MNSEGKCLPAARGAGQYGFLSTPPPRISRPPLDIQALHWAWAIQRLALLRRFLWRAVMAFPWNSKCHFGAVTKAIPVTHPWWSKHNSCLANETLTAKSLFWYMAQWWALLQLSVYARERVSVSSSLNDIVEVNGHRQMPKNLWSRTEISHAAPAWSREPAMTLAPELHLCTHPLSRSASPFKGSPGFGKGHNY